MYGRITRLAKDLNVKPAQITYLNQLADVAATAQEREHNEPNAPDSTPKIKAVENYIETKIDGRCIWPGLYPVIVKDGFQYEL